MRKFKFNLQRAEISTFRRWGRRGYSLFVALGKQVRIGVLAAVYLYVAMPEEVYAQTTDVEMKYDLDEIEVSARRAPVSYSQVARMVSVIDREQIETAPAGSIQDLLEYVSGVDIRQRGTYGIQADVSVRGGSFDQTLILLNGVNLSDPQTGHHNLNLPVSLKSIKRIEVLQGPAARVYGPNAFSGAINLITEPGDDQSLDLDAALGEHKLSDITASVNLKSGFFKNYISVNRAASDGYIENTDFDTYNLYYQGQVRMSPGLFDVQVGYSQKAFGANSFYSPEYPDQFENTKTTFASVRMHTGEKIHFTPALYWRRHQDRFELFREEAPDWYKEHNYHLTDVYGINLNSWFSSSLGKSAFGAEFRSENIWSNKLGEDMDEEIGVPGEPGHFFTKSHSRTIASYFAEHTVFLNRFTASAGAMVNWISDLNLDWHIYPGIDLGYQISDQLKAFGSINKSLRMPTFTDLYYNGPTNKGNPDLKPEKSMTFEAGFNYSRPWMKSQVAYYHRVGKDLIDWVRESEEILWETRNLTKIVADGIETTFNFDIHQAVGKEIFLRRVGISYAFNHLDKGASDYLSNYNLDHLKHKLVVDLNHTVCKNMDVSWMFRFQDRQGNYARFEGTQYTGEQSYDPFWLTDVKVSYRLKAVHVYLTISNLFDESYVDLGNVKQPGRWLSAGLKYKLQFN
ncbi:MAG: TonB-dependent receptor [Prolixibacteraceae bacterium]